MAVHAGDLRTFSKTFRKYAGKLLTQAQAIQDKLRLCPTLETVPKQFSSLYDSRRHYVENCERRTANVLPISSHSSLRLLYPCRTRTNELATGSDKPQEQPVHNTGKTCSFHILQAAATNWIEKHVKGSREATTCYLRAHHALKQCRFTIS